MSENRRIKVDEAELDRLAPLCGFREMTPAEDLMSRMGMLKSAPAVYNTETGELEIRDPSNNSAQCLIRTIECVGEEVDLEEGIEVTKGATL